MELEIMWKSLRWNRHFRHNGVCVCVCIYYIKCNGTFECDCHDNFKSLQSAPMRLYFILSPLMH